MKSKPEESKVNHPTVASRAEWLVARKELHYELRSRLGMQGKTPDQIAEGVAAGVSPSFADAVMETARTFNEGKV